MTVSTAVNGVPNGLSSATSGDSVPTGCPLGIKIYANAQNEYELIKNSHRTLATTGCTPEFCQSGRMTRTFEPRVGRDRPLGEIQKEAEEFLRECRDVGVIQSDALLDQRIKEALVEIAESSLETVTAHADANTQKQLAGGVWYQTPEELEYGLRASWRNSRRCIMRSEHEHLALCDLRHINSSRSMAMILIKELQKAFNRGHILPTAFVFPPRLPGQRGPMLWNDQILAFAGYKQEDGSILGDPKAVDFTAAVIELGWKPPIPRTKWDVLPLVTMAEGQNPYMTELPHDLKRLVNITHPKYEAQFSELDLKWVMFPALSRLGFDIGGVQYTASPFIGWFMDAEIGVRDLGDTFRYNALPDVVKVLKLSEEPDKPLDDIPEYLRMVALLRAQAELNFAVYYSYLHDHVMMIDTITSSIEYKDYDDQRKEELGYRLPADPYWLAPPQGSIVPLWHEGGAPNYQPKPMVARHVQDPIKAWKRENPTARVGDEKSLLTQITETAGRPKIMIFSCSAGITAGKLAARLSSALTRLAQSLDDAFEFSKVRALNSLDLQECGPSDIVLIIASTTGRGDMPRNAQKFVEKHKKLGLLSTPPKYSIYANGDSTYGDSYNAAAEEIESVMAALGCVDLLDHIFAGDTAMHNPDWESFNHWLEVLDHLLMGQEQKIELNTCLTELEKPTALTKMPTALVVSQRQLTEGGLILLTLDIGTLSYQEMDHIKIITPNPRANVATVLKNLSLTNESRFTWHDEDAFTFMNRYVDLSHSFKTLGWYPNFSDMSRVERQSLLTRNVLEVLDTLDPINDPDLVEQICRDMASINPRLYSVASSPSRPTDEGGSVASGGTQLDILVKINEGGCFSQAFLSQAQPGYGMRFGLTSPDTWKLIQAQKPTAPLIAIVTGSGVGPVRALLQRRIADITRTTEKVARPRATMEESTVRGAGSLDGRDQLKAKSKLSTVQESVASEILAHQRKPSLASRASSQANSRRASIASVGGLSNISSRHGPHGNSVNHRAHLGVRSTLGTVSLFVGYKKQDQPLIDELIEPAQKQGIFELLEKCPSNPGKVRIQDHILRPEVRKTLQKKLKDPACIVFVCANDAAADAAVANLSQVYGADIKEALGDRYIEELFRG